MEEQQAEHGAIKTPEQPVAGFAQQDSHKSNDKNGKVPFVALEEMIYQDIEQPNEEQHQNEINRADGGEGGKQLIRITYAAD